MREEKKLVVAEIQRRLNQSPYLILTDYTGLKVAEFGELRARLQKTGAEVHVVKNTFLRHALAGEQLPGMESHLKGQTALVHGKSDVCAAAKILKNFEAEFQKPKIRAGIVDKIALDARAILVMADLPPKEILLAQLLGLINSPATKLARLIQTPAAQLAQVIKAKSEKP